MFQSTEIFDSALDLYSTSQKLVLSKSSKSERKCDYHAPFFAIPAGGKAYALRQGCCNHWDCGRCGQTRAKQEYWRIVQGALALEQQGQALWFITITTRGGGLKVAEAEAGYLEWTNRFLSRLRADAKRISCSWCYVQVTERQKRRHPHSHILSTYVPDDIVEGCKPNYFTKADGSVGMENIDAIRSDYLQEAVCSSGLGEQYDISKVRSSSAVSRYIGKYLFKSSLLTAWPTGWKRVRYSHSWPKFEQPKTEAIPIVKKADWFALACLTDKIVCYENAVYAAAVQHLWAYPVQIALREDRQVG